MSHILVRWLTNVNNDEQRANFARIVQQYWFLQARFSTNQKAIIFEPMRTLKTSDKEKKPDIQTALTLIDRLLT